MKSAAVGLAIGLIIAFSIAMHRMEQKIADCQTAALSADRIINEDSNDDRDYKAFNGSRDACIM